MKSLDLEFTAVCAADNEAWKTKFTYSRTKGIGEMVTKKNMEMARSLAIEYFNAWFENAYRANAVALPRELDQILDGSTEITDELIDKAMPLFDDIGCDDRVLVRSVMQEIAKRLYGEPGEYATPAEQKRTQDELASTQADAPIKIYTHDEAAQIVEMFEDILDQYDIKVPSPDDDEREPDNEAKLYGETYSNLLDSVEDALIQLINRARGSGQVDVITGESSGNF